MFLQIQAILLKQSQRENGWYCKPHRYGKLKRPVYSHTYLHWKLKMDLQLRLHLIRIMVIHVTLSSILLKLIVYGQRVKSLGNDIAYIKNYPPEARQPEQ